MNKLSAFLRFKPFFLFLLPVFFVLHGFTENFGAVPIKDALYLTGVYIAACVVILVFAWLLFRDVLKAAFFSFCLMAFQFFFGSLQDMMKRLLHDSFFTRYSFILLFFLTVFVILFIFLKKSRSPLTSISTYLNILFCILLIIETGLLVRKSFPGKKQSASKNSIYRISCDSCTRPDIYLLLFDEYSSSTALKELWNFDNSDLDSFLVYKGFRIQAYSRSNYNFTPFSMASALNMDYLKTISNPGACTIKDYTESTARIKRNEVCTFLASTGYNIINYSIFDLDKNPSPVTEGFLPLKTKLITSQTFLSRIQKDLIFHLLVGRFEIKWLSKNLIYRTYINNEKIINSTLNESVHYSEKPRFIYSHIEMPHSPFYYNKNKRQTDKRILIEENNKHAPASYLQYIPRTNEVIRQLVNSIIDNAKRPVVIIILGDHGFRTKQPESYDFRNQNAIYISSGNHKGFYDSMSNVNEFRVLFNNLFQTSYPLLKDSTTYLVDE